MNKKNYLLGLYILILPVLLFLNTSNLRQVNIKSIIFILISILIIFFLIITLYKIYSKIFNVKINDKILIKRMGISFYNILGWPKSPPRQLIN